MKIVTDLLCGPVHRVTVQRGADRRCNTLAGYANHQCIFHMHKLLILAVKTQWLVTFLRVCLNFKWLLERRKL